MHATTQSTPMDIQISTGATVPVTHSSDSVNQASSGHCLSLLMCIVNLYTVGEPQKPG